MLMLVTECLATTLSSVMQVPVWRFLHWASITLVISWLTASVNGADQSEEAVKSFFGNSTSQGHTNNWAVLVCSSRYWFNYRHIANVLGMYRTVKRLGMPDSNIILMLADDMACNPRNKFAATVYANPGQLLDLYGENIEVDYRGYEVTVENFIRVLTGRVESTMPRSKRLLSDERSNILVYMAGHGGNEFLKFQDNEEISAFDLADAFEQMWQKKRYHEIFFVVDTCQATSMYSKFYSPNILATGSSVVGENSYSYENDEEIGVAVIDSYTHYVLEYLEGINKTSEATMQDFFNIYNPVLMRSNSGIRSDLFTRRPLNETLVTDFFGGVAQVQVTEDDIHSAPEQYMDDRLPTEPSAYGTVAHSSSEMIPDNIENTTFATNVRPPDIVFDTATILSPTPVFAPTLRAWGGLVVLGCVIGLLSRS